MLLCDLVGMVGVCFLSISSWVLMQEVMIHVTVKVGCSAGPNFMEISFKGIEFHLDSLTFDLCETKEVCFGVILDGLTLDPSWYLNNFADIKHQMLSIGCLLI